MKINCKKCGGPVGEIQKGSILMKGLCFVCPTCYWRLTGKMEPKTGSRQTNFDDVINAMEEILGGKK
jgi:hypothetical protein